MLSLFSTSSDTAGFRLQYMEIYNWGTFHEKIFRMEPQGNNALLTGANASGKSTIIDALLTLMVPAKKDRFYNQSSGVEKKGNRTEETYVLGHYGNIQKDGDKGTTTQALRDQTTYSVLLATFVNSDQRTETIFQVRWFSGGELRRCFGLAHCRLEIQRDFQPFDGKGVWRRRLESTYRTNRNMVEFFEGPVGYADRITQLFGMRSIKALGLFNQIVGVKVLDDLDEFIRTNMLEERNAESQYIQLKDSFKTLIDAKTNIEKAKKQIEMLTPIAEQAEIVKTATAKLKQLSVDRETVDYWFARKTIELGTERVSSAEQRMKQLEQEKVKLRKEENERKEEERSLAMSIESDEVGRKIKDIEKDIERLEEMRDERTKRMDEYNAIAQQLGGVVDPERDVFYSQRKHTEESIEQLEQQIEQCIRTVVTLEAEKKSNREKMDEYLVTIEALKRNKNNIPVRESQIRDMILEHTGATKEEIPFIGELIRVSEDDMEWEGAIEKILHHFALHLIVPDKYYQEVNELINTTNLQGRITYYHYRAYNSLSDLRAYTDGGNTLLDKIDILSDSEYEEWIRDTIYNKYNYVCVDSLEDFQRYQEKVVTREGLIKFPHDRHEKDDRRHILSRENYILGWDNKEKSALWVEELSRLQEQEITIQNQIHEVEADKNGKQRISGLSRNFVDSFTDYEALNWKEYANRIQDKLKIKSDFEQNNNKINVLQQQLQEVCKALHQLSEVDIPQNLKKMFEEDRLIQETNADIASAQKKVTSIRSILLTDFEQNYENLKNCTYDKLKSEYASFLTKNDRERTAWTAKKRKAEEQAFIKIGEFKHPSEYITEKFKDWRSDVYTMPDTVDMIEEYQLMLSRLEKENLPKYEKQFNDYLQKTLTDKVGEFRMFFMQWKDSIDESIKMLNDSLNGIDYRNRPVTYIQLVTQRRANEEIREFRRLIEEAMPDIQKINNEPDGRRMHFHDHIEPLMQHLEDEDWRKRVMDVRSWFTYKAEEFNRETGVKETTYENMGHLSGGEKAQLTYTILGSAIAYQFGLTKSGLQENSFRFIAIDEAFKAQDEDKARYLIDLCKQLHLQLLVVTPNDNIHIVENDISYVYFVERKQEKTSWLYSMPIEQWRAEKEG